MAHSDFCRSRLQTGHDSLPGGVCGNYNVHLPWARMCQDCSRLTNKLTTANGHHSVKSSPNLHRCRNGLLAAHYCLGLLSHYWWSICKSTHSTIDLQWSLMVGTLQNPAVTLALWLIGGVKSIRAVLLTGAQFVGALSRIQASIV